MFKIKTLVFQICFIFTLLLNTQAQAIEFEAEYNIKAKGINIGTAKQTLKCEEQNCTLTSLAKAPKWAFFINESSKETINLTLENNELIWQKYHKELTVKKSGKTNYHHYEFYRDSQNKKIISIQKNMEWDEQKYAFDMISIAHALSFYAKQTSQNKAPLPSFYLQEDNKQYPLEFTQIHKKTTTNLIYKSDLSAYYYEWNSPEKQVKVWLVEELNMFPAHLELYDKKENNRLILQLKSHPKVK